MKKDYTHVCIVLDASGSMRRIENDVKGSFDDFLEKQREIPGKVVFDLFQFSDEVTRLVHAADLSIFKRDLMAEYHCSGCTALNDAVCTAIDTLGGEFAAMPESERPEHVLFAIITDGEENASRKFTAQNVRERIKRQTDDYRWHFDFLAANQDAFAAGELMGVAKAHCANFEPTSSGIVQAVARYSLNAAAIRQGKDND